MSEEDWGEDFQAPKKKSIPGYVWTCGCGCLLLVGLAVAGMMVLGRSVLEDMDPEKQWAELAKVLPQVEDPVGLEIGSVPFLERMMGVEILALSDRANAQQAGIFIAKDEEVREKLRKYLSVDGKDDFFANRRFAVEPFLIEVQGQELEGIQFQERRSPEDPDPSGMRLQLGSVNYGDAQGASCVFELPLEDSSKMAVIQLTRDWKQDPYTQAEVEAFLKPFRIGPVGSGR